MSYEESYAKAFPFDKMIPGMLDPEMIEDTAKIMNEAIKDKAQVNLIINNRVGGNAPPDRPEDCRPTTFREAAKAILIPFPGPFPALLTLPNFQYIFRISSFG